MRSGPRSLLAAAALVLAMVGLAAPATAVPICTFAAPTATITLTIADTASIRRSGDAITMNGSPCDTATVTTTDTIVVNASGAPALLEIDLGGGPFAPGATDEGNPDSEIEFTVTMASGPFRITGSPGDDHVVAGVNGANLNAQEATADLDVTVTGAPTVTVDGGDGTDSVSVGGGSGTGAALSGGSLLGGAGDDALLGGLGGGTLDGGDGSDTADYAGATQLTLADLVSQSVAHQGGGVDALVSIENLSGSPGDDTIVGNDGANALRGAEGSDVLDGNGGDDTIEGGAGSDTLDFRDAANGVDVDLANHTASGEGRDTVSGVENVIGTAHDDDLTGDAVANVLAGGDGNDRIDGGDEADTLVGGDGKDTAAFASAAQGVTVDLRKGTAKGAGSDTLDGFENVEGSGKADTITGAKGVNKLNGKGGSDRVSGGDGNDDVLGGDGNDILFGQNGNDVIKGGNGKDQLNGGQGGHDVCNGGPDPDSFVFCENYPT
jgi:Ca2+-binding RTX toxin-like protein